MVFRISFEGYPRNARWRHPSTHLPLLDKRKSSTQDQIIAFAMGILCSPHSSACALEYLRLACAIKLMVIIRMSASTCQYRLHGTFRISSMKAMGTPVSVTGQYGYRLGITAVLIIAPPSRCMRRFLKRTRSATSRSQASAHLYRAQSANRFSNIRSAVVP